MKLSFVLTTTLYWTLASVADSSGENRSLQEPAQDRTGAQAFTGIRVGETAVFDGNEFVGIPPGEFLMGSSSEFADDDERPLTRVRIAQGFYLGKYEVTQAQWQSVMGSNPSQFAGCRRCPVEQVSWHDVEAFIRKLNARSGGKHYRLPTEAEWEYAARAGTATHTYGGDLTEPLGDDPVVNRIAWYRKNSGRRTQPVGRKAPNAFGLYDMLGNVFEWVGDWHGPLPGGSVTDPAGPSAGSRRVQKGGGWLSLAGGCRAADRHGGTPDVGLDVIGFRLVRTE